MILQKRNSYTILLNASAPIYSCRLELFFKLFTEEDPLEDVDEDEQPLGERLKEGSVLIAKATKKGIRQFLDSSKKK